MQQFFVTVLLGLVAVTCCRANLSGPYLFWGHDKVLSLQPKALVEANEEDLTNLFKDAKAIVVFIRNNTQNRLSPTTYPKFQKLIKNNVWTYMPQRSLSVEPFNYNANIEIINLSDCADEADEEVVTGFNDAITIYGDGEVLAILAYREEEPHFLAKREAAGELGTAESQVESEDESRATTTSQTPTTNVVEETEQSFLYVADKNKAVLMVNAAPVLNISNAKEPLKLVEHQKAITFDDQSANKHYGRFIIIFSVDEEKLFLRFNFTLIRGTWAMKEVEVEYKEIKKVLPIVGTAHNVPSAPLKFSYRCSAHQMLFRSGNDSLVLSDYQVQPWLNGSTKFGDVYDCINFTSPAIWSGVLVSLFLCGILSIGILALMDIKAPNRFESSRSKQLSFFVQE